MTAVAARTLVGWIEHAIDAQPRPVVDWADRPVDVEQEDLLAWLDRAIALRLAAGEAADTLVSVREGLEFIEREIALRILGGDGGACDVLRSIRARILWAPDPAVPLGNLTVLREHTVAMGLRP